MSDSFEIFWSAYDKKVGKDKCITKWALISATDQLLIMNHVHRFVAKARNRQFRPNPLSYLNGKMWLDQEIKDEETTQLYKTPSQPQSSTYKPKEFSKEEGKAFIIGRIKKAYEGTAILNDIGESYTNRLKTHLNTPPEALREIVAEVYKLINTKPRNRFEEKREYNYELEVRNRILKYNLDRWVSEGRKIYLEL